MLVIRVVEAEVPGSSLVVQKEVEEDYLPTLVVVVVVGARPSQASNDQSTLSELDSSSALWTV